MNIVVYNLSTGLVTGVAQGVSDVQSFHVDPGNALLEVDYDIDWATSRVVNGQVQSIPAKPEPHFVWDSTVNGWVDPTPIQSLKKEKRGEVDAERERRNSAAILFQGNPFDADSTAQRNVSAWMVNIAAGQNPPTGFVWRDFNNVDHPADAAFIVGLGNAITLRGSYLYQRSWIKKAEVDALTTAEEVKAYDVTTGW